jgi:hypothetical protein
MQEMIFQKGINWNDYSPREKRGSIIRRVEHVYARRDEPIMDGKTRVIEAYKRKKWEADINTPIISQDKDYLRWFFPQTIDAKENKVLM